MIRQDKFQQGERVEFVDENPHTGSDMAKAHRHEYGLGPYLIEEIEEVIGGYRGIGHTQLITINDTRYSGWWFKALR